MKGFKLCSLLYLFIGLNSLHAMDRTNRLGVGFTSQLKNDIPALSFKLQRSSSFALGGVFGLDTSDTGGWGAGVKLHRNLFDEPQLNFYASALGAFLNQKSRTAPDESGFQVDLTLGSEFSFTGLDSLGFSVEFGASFNKIDEFRIQTVGNSFIVAAAHFYL